MSFRNVLRAAASLAAGLVFSSSASAAVFTDATGEEFSGNSHLDISSVEVTNDTSNVHFKINLVGDPTNPNWGKYMIGIDAVPGGAGTGNGWGRPISMSSEMDYWIGSWVDSGTGQEVYHYSGSGWTRDRASYDATNPLPTPVVDSHSVTLTVPLALIGQAGGGTFNFDVYSAGGGGNDSANDASSNPNQSTSDWPGPYDSGTLVSTYTAVVPEPAALGLLGVAGLGLLARRRK
jgi:hypothetical protein